MSQQIEIEFKNLLTKEEYNRLLTYFNIQPEQIVRQENHYFDTPSYHLKNAWSGLRIRVLPDHIECTLKERSSEHAHLETTDALTADMAAQMIRGLTFAAPSVEQRLLHMNVPLTELQLFGSLITNRVEIDYEGGTLVLDHSFYLQCEDYEVEYETTDEQKGLAIFEQFLTEHNIEKRYAKKKIARFTDALAQQYE
ncbi:CYTH domain-containing protein [Lysinibacillus sp. KU-BSD001]|uniref:CYTH domain-containing protein n=1 Tax=Lysinibacillus sp. KU-BSD001 TaxID=3141328 RepID=UPI0036EC9907